MVSSASCSEARSCLGRRAANHRRDDGPRALLDPDRQVADLERVERRLVGDAERVADEVADRRQHAGDHVGILHAGDAGLHVLQEQPARAIDEKDLLDAEQQRLQQHDLAEGSPGPKRLDAPRQRPPRQAVLQRAIERLDHADEAGGHGLADGRAHHREERVGQRLRVALDRRRDGVFDRGRQRAGEFGVERPQLQGLRQHGGHLAGPEPRDRRGAPAWPRARAARARRGSRGRRRGPRQGRVRPVPARHPRPGAPRGRPCGYSLAPGSVSSLVNRSATSCSSAAMVARSALSSAARAIPARVSPALRRLCGQSRR